MSKSGFMTLARNCALYTDVKVKAIFYDKCDVINGVEFTEGVYLKDSLNFRPILVRLSSNTSLTLKYIDGTESIYYNPYENINVMIKLDNRTISDFKVSSYQMIISNKTNDRLFSFVDVIIFLLVISLMWMCYDSY